MIPIETQIFRLIFPPVGAIPLEKIEAVPHIRQHINSIIDLASTEHGISSPDESAALTARVIELRDTPGPDGKIRTWRTIAEICGTTLDAVRHRYDKSKATIRKSRTVEDAALSGYDIKDKLAEFIEGPTAEVDRLRGPLTEPDGPIQAINEAFATVKELGGDEAEITASSSETPTKPSKADLTPCQRGHLIGPKIPHELDDELIVLREAGSSLKEIVNHLDCLGIKCTEADVSARVLFEQRKRAAAKKAEGATVQTEEAPVPQDDAAQLEEPQEAEATDDRLKPVSISRKELDLLMWDLHKAGKTLDEISDILYSKGLYYSPKSVRVRLLSQGAKL
ncbi:MAG: hypothetical protein M0Q43_12000 [Methanothrix sp.]|jgi:hypothetical protein|nr:hypothetical protein [Methanothrix sp.]